MPAHPPLDCARLGYRAGLKEHEQLARKQLHACPVFQCPVLVALSHRAYNSSVALGDPSPWYCSWCAASIRRPNGTHGGRPPSPPRPPRRSARHEQPQRGDIHPEVGVPPQPQLRDEPDRHQLAGVPARPVCPPPSRRTPMASSTSSSTGPRRRRWAPTPGSRRSTRLPPPRASSPPPAGVPPREGVVRRADHVPLRTPHEGGVGGGGHGRRARRARIAGRGLQEGVDLLVVGRPVASDDDDDDDDDDGC
jgi:hypothetical protein